jgi:hypothetical protein
VKKPTKNTKQNIVFQCFHLFTSSRWFYHVLPLPEWAAGKTPTVLAMQRAPGNSAWHIFSYTHVLSQTWLNIVRTLPVFRE